jgi:hypothetical protein
MASGDIVTSVCLLALGSIIVGAGLWHLDRQDRRRVGDIRQRACRWHRWESSEDRVWLVCGLCGKKIRKINPRGDGGPGPVPLENIFP